MKSITIDLIINQIKIQWKTQHTYVSHFCFYAFFPHIHTVHNSFDYKMAVAVMLAKDEHIHNIILLTFCVQLCSHVRTRSCLTAQSTKTCRSKRARERCQGEVVFSFPSSVAKSPSHCSLAHLWSHNGHPGTLWLHCGLRDRSQPFRGLGGL